MSTTPGKEGFTLIEIMVAIAIIGTSLLILLDAHYNAMSLFAGARDEALMQAFLERVLGQAEVDLLAGTLEGGGDFGERYPGYSFSYTAQPVDKDQTVPLYEVVVNVKSPNEERSMNLIVFNMAQ